MKFKQKDFTDELMGKINKTELTLKSNIERLLTKYKPVFAKKNLDFDARFEKDGKDPFMPGYSSSISIGIADKNEEPIDFHSIKIWECERSFIGIPTSKKIPGSKIIGELLDETFEEIQEELKEYIEEFLAE
ncbi:hypothetical protein [Peribacillus alkalitolerans]|uniref:hypothetical protein n=1 Tax=Peribacillus alkalitolerans TaxID=1550385 RepID=UPI0013D8DD03|nr:hypothetical protein [Peribacillus alkalitolerans]